MSQLSFTVLDSSASSLHKTTVLVTGGAGAVLVDAAFTRADAHRIAAAVLDSGKELTTVLITGADPDFYFGAEVLADTFPQARFLAPSDVIAHIHHSYEGKLQAWAHLGANLPTRLVELTPFDGGDVVLDETTLQLRSAGEELGDRQWFVYEPVSRSLVGGILLFEGLHVWTADTGTAVAREAWISALDGFEALQPHYVAAGHRVAGAPTDHTAITHTRDYLRFFSDTVAGAADAAQAEAALLAAYPDAGLQLAASLGTKVAKGEMTWG